MHSSLCAHLVVKPLADFLRDVREPVHLLNRSFRMSVHGDQNKLFSHCRGRGGAVSKPGVIYISGCISCVYLFFGFGPEWQRAP